MRVPPAPLRTMGHAPTTEAHTGLRALGWDLDLADDLGVSESRDLYRSEELLRAENDRLLARTWSIVGSTADLPERGSFLTVTIAGIPIVVVRFGDGGLRAFHNVCRHRGITLVEGTGSLGRYITCPYHQWSYGLDGTLVRVPQAREQFAGIDLAEWGLRPAAVTDWHGMILVNPSVEAPSLSAAMAGLDDRIDNYFAGPLVEVAKVSYDAACNWKLLVENHVDVYHLWFLHQRSLAPFDHRRFTWETFGDNWWSMEPRKDPSSAPPGWPWLSADEREGIGAYLLFPNLMMVTTSDTFATYDAVPVTPDQTRLTLRVRARPGTDPQPLIDNIGAFLSEDVEACCRMQKGCGSPHFDVGPLSTTHEEPIRRFHSSLQRALSGRSSHG